MSDNPTTTTNPIPMEVEEGGIEAYMVDYQRMLDGLDNPSEVNRVGVGTCPGDNQVERESNNKLKTPCPGSPPLPSSHG